MSSIQYENFQIEQLSTSSAKQSKRYVVAESEPSQPLNRVSQVVELELANGSMPA